MSEVMSEHASGAPVGTWSYRPGSWFGVFGAATTLLLPGSEKGRIGELWSRIDDGADFDDVLDLLLQSGLGVLPGFVLVGRGEGPTKILVRGASVRATVTAGDSTVELDGSTVTTWVERTLPDVTALSVTVDGGDPASVDLPIHGGLVRVGRVDHPPHLEPVEHAEPVVPAEPIALPAPEEPEALAVPAPEEPAAEEPATEEPAPEPPVTELATELMDFESSPLDDEGGDTSNMSAGSPLPPPVLPPVPPAPPVLPPWPGSALPPPPPPPFSPPSDEATFVPPAVPLSDPLTGDIEVVDETGEPVEPVDVEDHDGMTQVGVDPDEFARPLPGIPGQQMASGVGRSVARLVISHGETVDVDRVVLVGRAPEARRFTTTDQPLLVTVPSPLHEISSTHVEIRPGSGADHGSAVVTDMGSTNGTVLVQPGLAPEELKPGIAVQLIPGAVINLGDGVTIQVTHP
ncbi:MAG: hypothetical protein JWN84_1759 [Nocardioides sp.]|nr:hypothetical protein [Nocardioides sp.]